MWKGTRPDYALPSEAKIWKINNWCLSDLKSWPPSNLLSKRPGMNCNIYYFYTLLNPDRIRYFSQLQKAIATLKSNSAWLGKGTILLWQKLVRCTGKPCLYQVNFLPPTSTNFMMHFFPILALFNFIYKI